MENSQKNKYWKFQMWCLVNIFKLVGFTIPSAQCIFTQLFYFINIVHVGIANITNFRLSGRDHVLIPNGPTSISSLLIVLIILRKNRLNSAIYNRIIKTIILNFISPLIIMRHHLRKYYFSLSKIKCTYPLNCEIIFL